MSFFILRNNTEYGPYDIAVLRQYVDDGKILLHDRARDADSGEINTVGFFLKRNGIKTKIKSKGSFVDQLRAIGSELILPISLLRSKQWLADKRLILLALVGLGPSFIMLLPIHGFGVFYAVALYFAAIWGLFFYYFFRTPQVRLKITLAVFFLTQGFVFLVWDILGLPSLNPFYHLLDTTPFHFNPQNMKRLILTLIIGVITMLSVNAQATPDDLSSLLNSYSSEHKASITFSNQSAYTMVLKVLHAGSGLYSTVTLRPHSSSTMTFSRTETLKLKIKATSANGSVSYHDGGNFSVTCTSTEWTEGTMSFRMSTYGTGLGPTISAREFESNY